MLKSKIPLQTLHQRLGALMANKPDLLGYDKDYNFPDSTIQWLAKATALVKEATGISTYSVRMETAVANLVKTLRPEDNAKEIILVMNHALANLELQLPVDAQGAFVTAGSSLDAYAALSKIMETANSTVLIVDPYMDATAVIEVAELVSPSVSIQLLSDAQTVKPSLKPASEKWLQQYGQTRPLEVRLATAKSLHDRLIFVDAKEGWILTQSLKDFAQRSPATIQRADAGLAALKIQAFGAIWNTATPLV